MSRNRYDDDDMYDYDDDYDEYEAYFKKPAPKAASKKAAPGPAKAAAAKGAAAKGAAASSSAGKPKAAPAAPVQADPLNAAPKALTAEEYGQMDMMELMGFDGASDGNITSVFTKAQDTGVSDYPSDDDLDSFAAIVDASAVSAASGKKGLVMIVSGHVDAGKSTLIGSLLHRSGEVSQKEIRKFEKESKNIGKASFALAWVMDEGDSERQHGVTIGIAQRRFVTPRYELTVLDSPGHRDYVPSMITGAVQADVGLLVVPASVGEYESATGLEAQTREHATLLRTFGVSQLLVVVNKMDSTHPPWSAERYGYIVSTMSAVLFDEVRYARDAVRFVPLSGLTGENVVGVGSSCPLQAWYSGPSLVAAVDAFRAPTREARRPLRCLVVNVGCEAVRGCSVQVAVLQGVLSAGKCAHFVTANCVLLVKKIVNEKGDSLECLLPGEIGFVQLCERSGRSSEDLNLFNYEVVCRGPGRVSRRQRLRGALVVSSRLTPPMIAGASYLMYIYGLEIECVVEDILLLSSEGAPQQERPRCVTGESRSRVLVLLRLEYAIALEAYENCPALGSFALRRAGKTCAVGAVVAVEA